jgi:hypothetical protein
MIWGTGSNSRWHFKTNLLWRIQGVLSTTVRPVLCQLCSMLIGLSLICTQCALLYKRRIGVSRLQRQRCARKCICWACNLKQSERMSESCGQIIWAKIKSRVHKWNQLQLMHIWKTHHMILTWLGSCLRWNWKTLSRSLSRMRLYWLIWLQLWNSSTRKRLIYNIRLWNWTSKSTSWRETKKLKRRSWVKWESEPKVLT